MIFDQGPDGFRRLLPVQRWPREELFCSCVFGLFCIFWFVFMPLFPFTYFLPLPCLDPWIPSVQLTLPFVTFTFVFHCFDLLGASLSFRTYLTYLLTL